MKGVIGLLLIFTGLAIGYYVMIGKFPTASTSLVGGSASGDFGTPKSPIKVQQGSGGPMIPAHQMKWGVT